MGPLLQVFSHYPTDYFPATGPLITGLKNPFKKIDYFGGHRHNVDQSSGRSIAPNNQCACRLSRRQQRFV